MSGLDPRAVLRDLFDAALAAVEPARCLPPHLPAAALATIKGRIVVIGAGKGAAAMAQAVEAQAVGARSAPGPLEGLVVVPYGGRLPTRRIAVVEARHPVPDEAGEAAARRILEMVRGLRAEDRVICLLSGGGSALLALPAAGITLADKQVVNQALLAAGARIEEVNCVRKHLSAIKGGRLALACGAARLTTLAISDVPGDDPGIIASGPTVPDPTTLDDAETILRRYAVPASDRVWRHLASGAPAETPKPNDPRFARADYRLIAGPRQALAAAASRARALGIVPLVIGEWIAGGAFAAASDLAAIARKFAGGAVAPCVLLSGGEANVAVRGQGRGGRCSALQLALALALDGAPGVWALAAGTDGHDGTGPHAGAFIGPESLARMRAHGLDPAALLADDDSAAAFAAPGDLVTTGATGTNVSDFRAILIGAAPAIRQSASR